MARPLFFFFVGAPAPTKRKIAVWPRETRWLYTPQVSGGVVVHACITRIHSYRAPSALRNYKTFAHTKCHSSGRDGRDAIYDLKHFKCHVNSDAIRFAITALNFSDDSKMLATIPYTGKTFEREKFCCFRESFPTNYGLVDWQYKSTSMLTRKLSSE